MRSDPSSERYGEHLSKKEVEALVAPHPTSIQLVEEWLASHGLSDGLSWSPAKDWAIVKTTVALAEEMLDTVRARVHPSLRCGALILARHITFGNTTQVERHSFAQHRTVSRSTFTITLTSSNRRLCSRCSSP